MYISKVTLKVIPLLIIILMMGCSTFGSSNITTIDPYFISTPGESVPKASKSDQTIMNSPDNPTIRVSTPIYTRSATYMPIPTDTPLPTDTPVSTDTPIQTDTPIPTETPAFVWIQGGVVIAPILLYHHISDEGSGNRYFVSMEDFRNQMQALRDWGYTSITAYDLADLIRNGGELPNRPVVITFDDGYTDVYQNAFPIMREMGFVGVIYIYVDHVGLNGFVNKEQIQTLASDGWGIGNHTMTHVDLTQNHNNIDYELQQSRLTLEEATGIKVETFAYPYGKVDDFVINSVRDYDYLAGMGLGLNCEHTLDTLFNLNRIEIQSDYNLSDFAGLLPWSDQ